MITVRQSITIERPIHEVFLFMTEAGNLFKWSRATQEVRQLTKDIPGQRSKFDVGAQFEFISKFMGQRIPIILEVTGYEEDRSVSSKTLNGAFDVTSTTSFEAHGANRTTVTSFSEIIPRGFWKFLEPLLPSIIRRNSARDHEALRKSLESTLQIAGRPAPITKVTKPEVSVLH